MLPFSLGEGKSNFKTVLLFLLVYIFDEGFQVGGLFFAFVAHVISFYIEQFMVNFSIYSCAKPIMDLCYYLKVYFMTTMGSMRL